MDTGTDLPTALRRLREEWDVFRRLRRCAGPFADPQAACVAWNRVEAALGDLEERTGLARPRVA